jgi:hypothetical protein
MCSGLILVSRPPSGVSRLCRDPATRGEEGSGGASCAHRPCSWAVTVHDDGPSRWAEKRTFATRATSAGRPGSACVVARPNQARMASLSVVLATVLSVLVGATVAAPSAVAATGTLDQSQELTDSNIGGATGGAQIFTPSVSGLLTQIDLNLNRYQRRHLRPRLQRRRERAADGTRPGIRGHHHPVRVGARSRSTSRRTWPQTPHTRSSSVERTRATGWSTSGATPAGIRTPAAMV